MRAGLDYLEHFPYECTEQTVSRFLPNIVTYRAYQALNIDNPELERRLPGLVSLGLQRLYNQQHLDGGWGWWSNDSSNPFLSAYVIQGMVEAERAGFAVDQTVMEDGISFLKRSLNSLQDTALPWQANRQAFILYVLAEAGEGDMGRTVSLYDRREKLDIYGRAYLALTFALLEADDPRIDRCSADYNVCANKLAVKRAVETRFGVQVTQQQQQLKAVRARHSGPAGVVRRARVILMSAAGAAGSILPSNSISRRTRDRAALRRRPPQT
jgi:uncharacterized protein YfaS (alpha-2-macroglobulin family)